MSHKSFLQYFIAVLSIGSLVYGMEKAKDLKILAHQLISAAWDNKIEQAKQLVEEPDIDINFIDCYRHNALNVASDKGHFEIVKLLVKKGANINLPGISWTPLMHACNENHLTIAKFLIEKGASVNLSDDLKCTPLILTSHPETTRLLLSNGARINFTTPNKWTALHSAARNNKLDKAKVLLANGIDIDLRDREGKTARDIAQDYKYTEIVAAIDLEITKKKIVLQRLAAFVDTYRPSIQLLLACKRT